MSESVKVAVRCRPMSKKELQLGCRNVLSIDPLTKCCTLEGKMSGGKVYQMDAAFGPESTTESVYEDVGSVIVEAVLHGYNGTVFAYGQTGCGKSYTMRGFIERALDHLFEATSTASTDTRYLALLSYLEIYNEKLRDLLQDAECPLVLKEDPSRGTYVAGGLREMTVKDGAECARLIEQGDRRRAAAATKMNAQSSRSHGVLTIALEAIAIDEDDARGSAVRKGRLHLVDLAGSERQARTGATGDRLKEAASINLSLSALGNVISALAAGNGRHVPYRDSKLTRLLRDSLGGNARTLMIACVSPSDIDADETLSTLRYAARARSIKNKPVINEDPKDALLRQYQVELQRLRKLVESTEQRTASLSGERGADREERYQEEVQRLREECENSNLSAQRLREELDALRLRYAAEAEAEAEADSRGKFEEGSDKEQRVNGQLDQIDQIDQERAERRRRKREAAKQEVLRRLEKLTIGGEALGDAELRKRRERRRKRLEALAEALEASADQGNAGVFQVYGQLKSTEDALKRMAKRAKQLEAEAADLQASWDAERRDLLRKELLMSQLCEAMLPHLRPGCPFRDIAAVRDAATWCDELGRWRLPDVTAYIPLPPAAAAVSLLPVPSKPDLNNNNGNSKNNGIDDRNDDRNDDSPSEDEETSQSPEKGCQSNKWDIADTYFRRNRINALLRHVREAKSFEGSGGRLSKSGGSDEPVSSNFLQLNALNLQSSAPLIGESNAYKPSSKYKLLSRGSGWLFEEAATNNPLSPIKGFNAFTSNVKKNPPRVLEALPLYPQGGIGQKAPPKITAVAGKSNDRPYEIGQVPPSSTCLERSDRSHEDKNRIDRTTGGWNNVILDA